MTIAAIFSGATWIPIVPILSLACVKGIGPRFGRVLGK